MNKAEQRKANTEELLALGYTPPQIARALGITPQRVHQIIAELKEAKSA